MMFWIVTVFACFVTQMLFSDFLSIGGVFPNILLLSTIYFAVRSGPEAGEWLGFLWGLLADVASTSIFGSQTFMFTLIGYACGRLHGKVDEEMPVAQMGMVFVMSVFYWLGLFFFEHFFSGAPERFTVAASLFQPLYSTLVSPVLFWLLSRWCMLFQLLNFRGVPE